jgi:hypothetical protein
MHEEQLTPSPKHAEPFFTHNKTGLFQYRRLLNAKELTAKFTWMKRSNSYILDIVFADAGSRKI